MTENLVQHARQEMKSVGRPYRVMVVEDSLVIRALICRALDADPGIEVAKSVGNGKLAVESIKRQPVDVVVLDIEMPVMDGLTALPQIIGACPSAKVIIASTLTVRNADISLRALAAGAADYLAKPSSTGELRAADTFKAELIAKVKVLGAAARRETGGGPPPSPERIGIRAPKLRPMPPIFNPVAIAVGSSTGGPQALMEVLSHIGSGLRQPVFITQHMPPTFTALLAEHIGRRTGLPSAEGKDGDPVVGGRVYIAPGGFHMTVRQSDTGAVIRLDDGPMINYCRPAVDPMIDSVAAIYGRGVLAMILTGMGRDGADGCKTVARAGGVVVAQDEETSVVWGMPGATAAEGVCNAILPLAEIGPMLRNLTIRPAAWLNPDTNTEDGICTPIISSYSKSC